MRATIPYIRQDIPIVIVFRALGFVSDRDILRHICYDLKDKQLLDLIRPSLEEAVVVTTQEVALDFIGKRGSVLGAPREKRIQYAKSILQKEFLPHVGTDENRENQKAYFFGYMINKLLSTSLLRREPDDRDHFGNKRMDLAGALMGALFRQLFAKMMKELRITLGKKVYVLFFFSVFFFLSSSLCLFTPFSCPLLL
jgi:DNA-directed RNA polymerase II subunit RPB2